MEFKEGDRVNHRVKGDGTISTWEEWQKVWPNELRPSHERSIPVLFDTYTWEGKSLVFTPKVDISLIKPARVPLSEVSTAEEAEAWVGEEVEAVPNLGPKEWYRGKIIKWSFESIASCFVRFLEGPHTGESFCAEHYDKEYQKPMLRPLSQEPVTPGEGKPSEATGGELIVDRGARDDYTSEDPSKRCPHCRADLRAEAHTEDCPCRPVVKDEVVVDAAVLDREEWLDSLERLSHIDPWKLARWAKEGKPAMDE